MTFCTALLWLLPASGWGGGVVTNCTEANLRTAMAGGGTVTFACDGTILLSNTLSISTDTVVEAGGHEVIISGGNAARVFYLGTNVNLTLSHLTIANGRSDKGGGVYNAAGQLVLQDCTLSNNTAIGLDGTAALGDPGTNGYGGALYNLGVVYSINCEYISNSVVGGAGQWANFGIGGGGGSGDGGAIANFGLFTLSGCVLGTNCATGGAGGQGGISGQGGSAGDGNGGAIANFGTLTMKACLLTNNSCRGGAGGFGGSGTYYPGYSGTPGGPGGMGGSGNGGGLFNNGSAFLLNDTITFNTGTGGQGGSGGSGGPPWNQGTYSGNGGNGANGGSGYGAVDDLSGQCYLTNCTVALNGAIRGNGGTGGPAGPWPYPYPPKVGTAGLNGNSGTPGSGLATSGAHLINTLVATNTPTNCTGVIVDSGHNLSSDASANLTGPGSLTNTDAKIGPLANNGGLSPTFALLPGSPAIDSADTSAAPLTDQRGFPRPAGVAADIGAFEYGSMMPVLTIIRPAPGLVSILAQGNSNQWCRLFASSNFSSWQPISTNRFGGDGTYLFQDNSTGACRFYRVVMP